MGRRGPKPEPAAVKLQKGNAGHRPIGADPEPAVDAAVTIDQPVARVAAPAWLKGEAREVWERLAPRLIGMKLLSQIDAYTFARYCTNFARWLSMQRRLSKRSAIYEIETASGKVRRTDPAFFMAERLDRRLEAVEDRFGLNPAERQRIFAARAAVPNLGDLFGGPAPKPAASESGGELPVSEDFDSPVGMLN